MEIKTLSEFEMKQIMNVVRNVMKIGSDEITEEIVINKHFHVIEKNGIEYCIVYNNATIQISDDGGVIHLLMARL